MVFYFGMPSFKDAPELTTDEIEAMCDTLVRVHEALAVIVSRERARREGLMDGGRLTRHGLNAATDLLGMSLVTDEKWRDISGEAGSTDGGLSSATAALPSRRPSTASKSVGYFRQGPWPWITSSTPDREFPPIEGPF
ncbi:hypothetical protein AAH991_23025 [Microbispora sp. ZYX-F-249]|uniref:Uncharacterized protein n=1 Tax=Microbispora maris TaxID=3144104 RepID=A0ABV0AVJ3_9ACTN